MGTKTGLQPVKIQTQNTKKEGPKVPAMGQTLSKCQGHRQQTKGAQALL